MTSLDDQLHDLFDSATTPVDDQGGDLGSVRAGVRRRQFRQRASVLAVAATVVAVAGIALGTRGGGGERIDTGDDGTTIADEPSTPDSTPSTTGTTEPPPATQHSIRDADLGALTYPAPCPAFDDRPITLTGGVGENTLGDGAAVQAELGDVAYADADGDGDEDAVVVVNCTFAGASTDTGLMAVVFWAGADGEPVPLGEPLTLEHPYESSLDGLALTVRRDVYAAADAACCPSSGVEEVWRFDGLAFQRESTEDLPSRSSSPKPPDSQTPAAGTCGYVGGDVVEVAIHDDVPAPRCQQVTAEQRLRISNQSAREVTVSLGEFTANLAPGQSELFDRPFGEYLQLGVHRVTAPIYGTSGPEIWLVTEPTPG